MAAKLHQQRCFNHAGREAVARCPECQRYYCRECVAEHDDRLLCAECLAKTARKPLTQRGGFRVVTRLLRLSLGVLIAWLFFHWTAMVLMRIPTEYHQGSVWQANWWEN